MTAPTAPGAGEDAGCSLPSSVDDLTTPPSTRLSEPGSQPGPGGGGGGGGGDSCGPVRVSSQGYVAPQPHHGGPPPAFQDYGHCGTGGGGAGLSRVYGPADYSQHGLQVHNNNNYVYNSAQAGGHHGLGAAAAAAAAAAGGPGQPYMDLSVQALNCMPGGGSIGACGRMGGSAMNTPMYPWMSIVGRSPATSEGHTRPSLPPDTRGRGRGCRPLHPPPCGCPGLINTVAGRGAPGDPMTTGRHALKGHLTISAVINPPPR